jgi:hypothetical protein
MKSREPLIPDPRQKRNIVFGVGLLVLVKILELPFQSGISLEAGLSILLFAVLIALVYFNHATMKNMLIFLTASCLIDAYIIFRNASGLSQETIIKILVILALVIAVIAFFNRERLHIPTGKTNYTCIFLILGLGIAIMGNVSYLRLSDPKLDESQALAVIEKIKEYPSTTSQIWVYENGWPVKHLDFTYWMIKNHIHPIRAYYGYYMKTTPPLGLKIGNTDYYIADYIIDSAYLENGNQNIPDVTFKVNNISVYKPENVFPNAFVVRNEQLIPVNLEKFTPDEVILNGSFLQGDIAVLKAAFYPGWKVNNHDASNVGNMVGAQLSSDSSSVTFKFDPLDVKIGAILTGIGIIVLFVLIIKRREFETYLKGINKSVISKKPNKGKKSEK